VPSTELPERVSRFISDHIPSIERLEILLLLFENRERAWTIDEIEEQIRSSRDSVAQNVGALVRQQILAAPEGRAVSHRYSPLATPVDETIAELAASYRTRRVAVIQAIYSERRDSIRSFSDAFKFGRPHDH
jgi:hypothetical protein